jgi:uncharacterized protein (TIGR00251 family)
MTTISLKIKPNARHALLEQQPDGSWLAHIQAPPVDGKANEALIALLTAHFGVRKAQVTIVRGLTSRLKMVVIDN